MDDKTATSEYIIIPKSILTDTRLCKPNITEFYGVILSLSRQTGYCFASNSYLADFMKCDIHTVTKWVTRLKQLGYIRAEYLRGDSSNNITQRKIYPTVGVLTDLSVPTNPNAEGVLTDLRGGYGQIGTEGTNPNAEYNNKFIITNGNNKLYTSPVDCAANAVIKLPLKGNSEYSVTDSDISEYKTLYPEVDIIAEFRKMRGWLLANTEKRKTSRGIRRFINGWLTRADDGRKNNERSREYEQSDDYTSIGWG